MVAKTGHFYYKSALGNKDAQCNYKNHVTRNMFKHKCGGASTEAEKRAEKGRGIKK